MSKKKRNKFKKKHKCNKLLSPDINTNTNTNTNTDYLRIVKEILFGVSIAVLALPFHLAIGCLEEWLRSIVDRPSGDCPFDAKNLDLNLLFTICILGPMLEEVIFRKIFTSILKSTLTEGGIENEAVVKTSSILCSSALFAAAHDYGPKSPRFFAGVINELLTDQAGLHASIASHSAHNTILAIAAMKLGS